MSEAQPPAAEDKRLRLARLLAAAEARGSASSGERISPRPPGMAEAPLSFAQRRLWFLDRLVPGSPFYNVPGGVRIAGRLDWEAAERALNAIAERHEVLRSTIHQRDGEPFQRVHPKLPIPFERHDLAGLDPALRAERASALVREHGLRPFELESGPGIRAAVLDLGPKESIFLVCMHHIVSDGWSIGIFVREFDLLYRGFVGGTAAELPPLPIQYADFSLWQRRRLAEGALKPQLDYWTRRLEGLPTLDLPTDRPRGPVQSFDGRTLKFTLPSALTSALHVLARREHVTLFTVLLAGFKALLHRYTGQDDIVIGEPVANRNRLELEPLIGFFVNSLVLRTDLSGNPSFVELVRRCRTTVLEADANQDVPFEWLVEVLRPERTMGRNPLFQVSLQFFSGGGPGGVQPANGEDLVEVEKGTASLDLAFDLYEDAQGIVIRAEYSTDLFTGETVAAMADNYRILLEAFAANPALRLSQAPMLPAAAAERPMGPGAPRNVDVPLAHGRVAAQAARAPRAVALDDGVRQVGYGELDAASERLAAGLAGRRAGPETVVALCLPRSITFVEAMLGIWRCGAALLPLDPAQPEPRLRHILEDSRPALVLAQPGDADRFAAWGFPAMNPESLEPVASDFPREAAGAANLAYIVYTSGSSGRPKGVAVEHGALALNLDWMQKDFPLFPTDRALFKYAVTFDVALLEILSALGAGATLHVVGDPDPVDPARLATLIREVGITVLDLVPAQLAALVDLPAFRSARTLRRIVCGGEALPADLLATLLDRTSAEVVNMYGPTEATISATAWRAEQLRPGEPVPIGRPGTPYTAHVVDRYLNPLPTGVAGELCLGGPCLARGYVGLPALTREKFVPDPFTADGSGRLYRTGDRARWRPNGLLEFIGRKDDQVKLRGFRIELGEIESVLAENPHVRAGGVALRTGKGDDPMLVAYVVPNDGEPEFWPSVGEYFAYDELLYAAMTNDNVRMRAYKAAIDSAAGGRVVVDIGTGGDLALTRLCLEAGAKRVYAVEMDRAACESARRLAQTLGAGDRIAVIEGDSCAVSLPEPADLCVSELIGTVGSSEGVIPILNDARRFLKPGGRMIPQRCVTRIAAVSLPAALREWPSMSELPRHYAERIFDRVGRRFDLRVCVKNLPGSCIVSDSAEIEDLRFDSAIAEEDTAEVVLTVGRAGAVDGFLLWIALEPGGDQAIDSRVSDSSWLPLFLPVFPEPVQVEPGDTIRAVVARLVPEGEFAPDYFLKGDLVRRSGERIPFRHESARLARDCGGSPFYEALFDTFGKGSRKREARRVDGWRTAYDRLYTQPSEDSEPEFDCTGWDSSYDNAPLSDLDMREQVEGTVDRVAALKPCRILEIGCGTGLLLFPLARRCDAYVGTDFSAAALDPLASKVRERGLEGVELLLRAADDFSGFEDESFDVVLLNSVIQYFPSMSYLVRTLEGAMRVLRPGGHIFVGDVRSRSLLRVLHADLELAQSRGDTSVAEFRRRLRLRWERERELAVDPAFFAAFAARRSGFAGASVQAKRGRRSNELSLYRYDAWLRRGDRSEVAELPEPALDWSEAGGAAGLRALAEEAARGRPATVKRVPSRRLARQKALLAAIDSAAPDARVADLVESLGLPDDLVEPEDLWALGEDLGVEVQIGWDDPDAPEDHRVMILPDSGRPTLWGPSGKPADLPWFAYGNEEVSSQLTTPEIELRLRDHLRSRLPEHMVPTAFVFLDSLPLTAHGKLDRSALPAPDMPVVEDLMTPPATALEAEIAAVWGQVLGREKIGVEANFFNIGGHSLFAMQVSARLSQRLRCEVPLRLMFEHPTVRQLAAALDRAAAALAS